MATDTLNALEVVGAMALVLFIPTLFLGLGFALAPKPAKHLKWYDMKRNIVKTDEGLFYLKKADIVEVKISPEKD